MKKLFLLVAVAATFTFAACTNAKTTEQPEEEATIEEVQEILDEASDMIDSANVMVEEVIDSIANPVD